MPAPLIKQTSVNLSYLIFTLKCSKTFYRHFASRKSNTPSIKELIINGVSINKSTALANAFNEHFSTVGPKLANQIPSAANGDKSCLEYLNITDQRFCFTPTNTSQVLLLLNKLSKSKATGLDYISARLIRECADLI